VQEEVLAVPGGKPKVEHARASAVTSTSRAVGAPLSSAAYAFRYNGLESVQEQILPACDGPGGHFGGSVVGWGNVIVIRTWGDDESGANAGSVHVFWHDGPSWIEQTELFASNGPSGGSFG
jgi:hypothetical protein